MSMYSCIEGLLYVHVQLYRRPSTCPCTDVYKAFYMSPGYISPILVHQRWPEMFSYVCLESTCPTKNKTPGKYISDRTVRYTGT
ncbi:hypothetical protein GDO81_021786 [Engystomops pustulosus]|uniref:Uncharacterized protein n=1 Tax=Engystomops pustulosus TaxID=76066 RepID=A0AAV6Z5R2_ENGPU|nr:hypothetical protein GDO81_021786 [Engystomops pustulosus]